MRTFTGKTTTHNVHIVVTTTNVTTRLPNIVTTDAAIPIVNMPVGDALRNVSTLLTVIRVPPNVPMTAMNVGTTRGTNVLTIRVLTLSSTRLTAHFTTFGRDLGHGVRGTGRRLGAMDCRCGI